MVTIRTDLQVIMPNPSLETHPYCRSFGEGKGTETLQQLLVVGMVGK